MQALGPRRFGKTSLLRRLEHEADLRGIATVYVDFFGALTLDDVVTRFEFAYERALRGPLARWFAGLRRRWRPTLRLGTPEAGVELSPLGDDDANRALIELLDLPARVLERDGRRTLAMFDEFQSVLAIGAGLDGLIRSRIQHHGANASYVFAGSHPGLMAELFGSRERPLYGQARALVLEPLADEDLAEFIGDRFERSGREVGAALEPLLELTRGHPQRAMLAAHHLWERTGSRKAADEATWDAASAAMFTELEDSFERIWEDLSANERRVMAAIAWGGPRAAVRRSTRSRPWSGSGSARAPPATCAPRCCAAVRSSAGQARRAARRPAARGVDRIRAPGALVAVAAAPSPRPRWRSGPPQPSRRRGRT